MSLTLQELDEVYSEIKRLDRIDLCSLPEAICKLSEEHGELVRAANKSFGRKVTDQEKNEVDQEVKEEIADSLQNLLVIASRYNFTLAEVIQQLSVKNKKWEGQIEKRQAKRNEKA